MTGCSVLVGIVTRNRAQLVSKAIGSALAQIGVNQKVSVVDDGSTDSTPEVAKTFAAVEWVRWSSPNGYVAARNFLMREAREDYYVSLDDDAWFIAGDEIALAVNYLEQHSETGAIAFDILTPDRPAPQPRAEAKQTAMFIGCGHVLRLSAFRAAGCYEPAPGDYGGEEKDLALRLLDRGHKIMLLPGVHVWHDKTAVARHFRRQHRSGVCNDLVMTLRRTPLSLLPVAFLAKFYRHMRFAWNHHLLRDCLAGFALFARSLPEVWRSRNAVSAATLRAYVRLSRS